MNEFLKKAKLGRIGEHNLGQVSTIDAGRADNFGPSASYKLDSGRAGENISAQQVKVSSHCTETLQ